MNHYSWHVGQKVVCVDDTFPRTVMDWCNFLPVAGDVYTIRTMQVGMDGSCRGASEAVLGFLLEEFSNPPSSLGFEGGFKHTRFKPLIEATTESVCEALEQFQLASTP